MSGNRFGLLRVIERKGSKNNRAMWLCQCDCGNRAIIYGSNLRSGNTRSCGCLIGVTHGHTRGRAKSPTYESWSAMISRCTQPSNVAYDYYKSRGIKICDRWLNKDGVETGFGNFLADVGERPSLAHSIDRHPNNEGNYEPSNCRWATKREQANNRVTNQIFDYRGTKVSLTELARLTGVAHETLRHRLLRSKHKWTVEQAISSPKRQGQRTDLSPN